MIDWREIDKVAIFTGKDEHGNRYLSQFLKDYAATFNPDMINAGCQRCLEDYYTRTIKELNTMKEPKNESGYVLKPKYQGISLEFGSNIFVTNGNITKEYGDTLLEKHPKGAELFEIVPKKKDKTLEESLLDHTRQELDAIATNKGLNPSDYSNKGEIAKAISQLKTEDKQE